MKMELRKHLNISKRIESCNYVFDLDGTLIDSSERMYRLFQKLIPESEFTKEQYWKMKRNKINHKMILEKFFPQYDFEDFNYRWLKNIELDEYLDMDYCFPDTIEVLKKIKEKDILILLTARQSKHRLQKELTRLGLDGFFDQVLVTEAKKSKLDLLKESNIERNFNDLFVSDMGKDILDGKELGYRTVGISHGFMCEEKLRVYKPDLMIKELRELFDKF